MRAFIAALLLVPVVAAQPRPASYLEVSTVRPLVQALGGFLPPGLPDLAGAAAEARWRTWLTRHDASVRRRLAEGDEDTVLNWLLLGRTFTALPSASTAGASVVRPRVEAFLAALESPGGDERRRFARSYLEEQGLRFTATAAERERARAYLLQAIQRMLQADASGPPRSGAPASAFEARGLSLDTTIQPNFAVERSLLTLKARATLAPGRIRRIGVVGAGLDFADKNSGFDFYPVQTVQPFALLDALRRSSLTPSDGRVEIVALDISPRVLSHIAAARGSRNYVLQLPLADRTPWSAEFRSYWSSLGDQIGTSVSAAPAAGVAPRAVRVSPAALATLAAEDVNVIVQRSQGPAFDLIVATNVLVYYGAFEQAMAMANIAGMLAPDGLFLTNTMLPELAATGLVRAGSQVTLYTIDGRGDEITWYRRGQ